VDPADADRVTNPLTGLGLFTRATVPQPTSIAVDLGLRAAAPRADRPWACRVSTALRRPGPDGLAHHVPEIEALAKLGRAIVAAVTPTPVLAAAVTTSGTRTWLLYVAGAEPPVLAGQADYAATVAVESDPEWAGYLSLFPTPTECEELCRRRAVADAVAVARSATQATVQSLRAAGVDLTRPSAVRYRVDVPAAGDLVERATATGLRAEPGPPLCFVRDDLPDLALILRTERWLIGEAARAGGRYEGWAAA
jgi:hypothetical protein